MKRCSFRVPVYNIPIHCIFAGNEKQYAREIFKVNYELGENNQAEVDIIDSPKGVRFVMVLPKKHSHKTILHESIHMSWFVLDFVQQEIEKDNHEALTYLTEFIFENVNKKLYNIKVV